MIGWTKKNREKIEENAFEQTKKKPGLNSNPVLELFWALEQLGPVQVRGRDPFNQNFRKFRSKTQWIGSVQLEKLRKNWSTFWGGPLLAGRTDLNFGRIERAPYFMRSSRSGFANPQIWCWSGLLSTTVQKLENLLRSYGFPDRSVYFLVNIGSLVPCWLGNMI